MIHFVVVVVLDSLIMFSERILGVAHSHAARSAETNALT
jgi:hypothetical protein